MSDNIVWQDREIRFDMSSASMSMRKGEKLVETLKNIEDKKGNEGEVGTLLISNLRIIWYCNTNQRVNLSIGYDCILSIEIKIAYSNSQGSTQSLNIRSKFNNNRFEFIFSTMSQESPRIFTTFQTVCRAYESTKLYRDLKLRGSIFADKNNLDLLQLEKIINRHNNIYNLSSDQGNSGSFIFTNIRLIWFSITDEGFNISIPYIQIKSIKKKDSKFGLALVIETSAISGGYLLGFQADSLDILLPELQKLYNNYAENPILGVDIVIDDNNAESVGKVIKRNQDDVKFFESEYNEVEKLGNYLMDNENNQQNDPTKAKEIIVSEELGGLAIEKPRGKATVEQLWRIINVGSNN